MSNKKLTPKQLRFCQEYIVDLNGTQAAIRAGYSKKTAKEQSCQLLTKLNIKEKVAELQEKTSKKIKLNAEYVLNNLMEIVERAMEGTVVLDAWGKPKKIILDVDGEDVVAGLWKHDPKNAAKALELLGKHLKLFTDKVEHTGGVDVRFQLEVLNGSKCKVATNGKTKPSVASTT